MNIRDNFTSVAIRCEPRLEQVDFDFSEIMDINDDFAFISGSVVEGFGNQASDVDIYVVSKKEICFPDGKQINYTNEEKGYYNEINWFSYKWHKEVEEKINAILLTEMCNNKVAFDELKYYYRSSISIPLINSKRHEVEVSGYSKKRILNILEYFYGYQAYKALQYAKQLLAVDEIDQSYYLFNKAVYKMVDSALAANGEGYMSDKFRFNKIERAFGINSEMYVKTKNLRYLGSYKKLDYINEAIAFVADLGINKFEFEDTTLKYKISGSIEKVELYHSYVVHNANNVFQMDDECLSIISLISDGYDSRESIHKYCAAKCLDIDKDLDKIISQLQQYGILEIE